MPLKVSSTFFMTGTGGTNNPDGAHLMVCIAKVPPDGDALIVPIVSRHAFSDMACILEVGDHPFIKHQSCAAYDHARCIPMAAVKEEIRKGTIKIQEPASAAVVIRLQVGFVKSDETEPRLFRAAEGTKLTAHLKHKGHL